MQRGIMPIADERLTVKAFLARWLEDAARPSLRGTTYASYRGVVNGHPSPCSDTSRLSNSPRPV